MPRASVEDRPLTVKQLKFATQVAEGTSKAAAHRANYVHDPKYAKANGRKALDLANKPNVAAEIRRQVWLSMPLMDDIRGMRGQSIRIISDLSRSAKSETVRLQAAMALFQIADKTQAAARPTISNAEQDKLLDSLRGMYRRLEAQAAEAPDISPSVPLPDPDEIPIDIDAIGDPAAPLEPDEIVDAGETGEENSPENS